LRNAAFKISDKLGVTLIVPGDRCQPGGSGNRVIGAVVGAANKVPAFSVDAQVDIVPRNTLQVSWLPAAGRCGREVLSLDRRHSRAQGDATPSFARWSLLRSDLADSKVSQLHQRSTFISNHRVFVAPCETVEIDAIIRPMVGLELYHG
jgi:hypothetical protein